VRGGMLEGTERRERRDGRAGLMGRALTSAVVEWLVLAANVLIACPLLFCFTSVWFSVRF
jgi:hypothetical protein